MIFGTLLTIMAACQFMGYRCEQARQQKEAVAAIQKLGGFVKYDFQKDLNNVVNKPGGVFDPNAKLNAPDKLRDKLGDDFFQFVVFVSLRNTATMDDDLKQLKKLEFVETIDLTDTKITGAGLAHLSRLRFISALCVHKTSVDDKGLEHLKDLARMRQLILSETKITDAGLQHLRGMINMDEWLGLTDTQITDKGIDELKRFSKLLNLNLRRTKVTAAGARELKEAMPLADISYGP